MNARAAAIGALLVAAAVVAACTTTANFDYGGAATSVATSIPVTTGTGSPSPIVTPTPFVVQHVISTPTNTSSLALAFPGGVSTGDVVVVTVSCAASATISSVTDSLGNTLAVAGSSSFSGGEPVVVYWKKIASGAATYTVTVQGSATDSQLKAVAAELVGVSTPSQFAVGAGSGASITTASVAVSAGTIAFATAIVKATTTLTAFDGATLLDQGLFANETLGDEARLATATTSMRCAFVDQPSGSWACTRLCFLP